MNLFDKLKFHAWDSVAVVVTQLEKWTPQGCATEKDYEASLYAYLHKAMPDIQVTKQYAQGRIRADLVIGDKVIVELKKNLDTRGKFQRLIGQLTEYNEWTGRVVLLTGKTDPHFRKELDQFIRRDEFDDDWEAKITIFEK